MSAGTGAGPFVRIGLHGSVVATVDPKGSLQRWHIDDTGSLTPSGPSLSVEGYDSADLLLGVHGEVAALAGETLQLFDWRGETVEVLPVPESATGDAAFSPDGRWFVFGPGPSFDLFALDLAGLEPGREPELLRLKRGQSGTRRPLRFSEDGRWLAADDRDGTRLCDLSRDDPFGYSFVLSGASPDGVAFSSDGRWVVARGSGARLHLFPVGVDDLMDFTANIIGRNLTREEWAGYFPGEGYQETFPGLDR